MWWRVFTVTERGASYWKRGCCYSGNSDWLLVHLDCANVCGTSNDDPQTSNDPQIGPQVIPIALSTANNPLKNGRMEWTGLDYRHGLWRMLTTWTTRKTMELTILLLKVIVSPFLLALSNVSDVSLPLKFKRGRSLRQAGNSSFISIPRNKEIWPCINLWQFIAQQKVPLNFQSNVPKMAPKVRTGFIGN